MLHAYRILFCNLVLIQIASGSNHEGLIGKSPRVAHDNNSLHVYRVGVHMFQIGKGNFFSFSGGPADDTHRGAA